MYYKKLEKPQNQAKFTKIISFLISVGEAKKQITNIVFYYKTVEIGGNKSIVKKKDSNNNNLRFIVQLREVIKIVTNSC